MSSFTNLRNGRPCCSFDKTDKMVLTPIPTILAHIYRELYLIGRNDSRSSPSREDIQRMYNEDEVKPYYVNGARVDLVSATPLLCQYCSSLSRDQYTIYAPDWYCEEKKTSVNVISVRVVIYMPTACPILEPIEGPFMPNKKLAKRAAALKACILLHKCGELNDNLLPVLKDVKEEDVNFLFTFWPKTKEEKAGFKTKKRMHPKQVADCIASPILPNQEVFLHVIKLTPCYRKGEDFNQAVIYDLYTTPLCFGILSEKALPELCNFPVFDSNGSIEVSLKLNVKTVVLNDEQLGNLRNFHFLIFNDVLRNLLKPFLVFDNEGTGSENLLLVPVQDSGEEVEIDYSITLDHKTIKIVDQPSTPEKMSLEVTTDDYLHKIVIPWYRTEPQPQEYIVTRVCLEKTAKSPFPNDDYESFVAYYSEKHNKRIVNPDHPLILVKGLSKRLNVMKPRGREAKRRKDKRYEELEEYLIPELVIKQDFPACLWVQAKFLPTIFSRITFLLKLKQLQLKIASDCNLEISPENPGLQLNTHLLDYKPAYNDMPDDINVEPSETNMEPLAVECAPLGSQQCNKDFAAKMLQAEFGWSSMDEPKDIERSLSVTPLDIENYEIFVSIKETAENRLLRNESPAKKLPAITYPQNYEEKQISILNLPYTRRIPALCDFYTALTTAEANDIVNLERLETLGDSFLKYFATLYIYFKFPHYNEGKSTTLKGKLVSNKNLYYLAEGKHLGGVLKNVDLSPKEEWVPPCFHVPSFIKDKMINNQFSISSLFGLIIPTEEQISGVLGEEVLKKIKTEEMALGEDQEETSRCNMGAFFNKQYVSDKSVADCVEALLGAFVQNGGFQGGAEFVYWIGLLPRNEDIVALINTPIEPIIDKKASIKDINFHLPQWQDFERRLGYNFKNRAFLLQALTHASYTPNRITYSYERLEFLGDAILDYLITAYIYEYCGYLDPGQLTDLRSALVNNNTFASLVVRCGFHKSFLMVNSKLQHQIDKFADYLAMKDYVIDDEVLILLEEDDLNIAEYVDVPKVLGDIFESLAGAVYLDSGKDLNAVWKVFYKIMWQEIDLFSKNVPKNVVRRLYETPNTYPIFSTATSLQDSSRTMVSLKFMAEGREKYVHGFGANKAMAKKAAAKIALRSIKI